MNLRAGSLPLNAFFPMRALQFGKLCLCILSYLSVAYGQ